MQTAQKLPVRKDIRLPNYDYSSPGWYFVTICTKHQKPLFSPAVSFRYGHRPHLNECVGAASYAARDLIKGKNILLKALADLEGKYYTNLKIDFYCIMPSHIHMIVVFEDSVSKAGAIGSRPYKYTLGDIVRSLKALVSRDMGESLWQRGFYEHIIRTESSLDRIRNYILQNPEEIAIDWDSLDPRSV